MLKEYGFTKVFCEDLSISEQIEIFWNASCVLAPHGAGLANIMFCQKGASIGEVHYAETVYNDHYWMLAQQFELPHSHLGSKKIDLSNGEYDLEANLGDIEKWLAGKAQGARR
jgi:capsular polysaccharide biosynthesis protein